MNTKKLNEGMDTLKEELGEGLLTSDIYEAEEGQSLVGYNSNPNACALFSRITNNMEMALDNSGFPGLGNYYILDLEGNKMVIILPIEGYQWGMMIDRNKVKLGMLLNIIIPEVLEIFEEAIS